MTSSELTELIAYDEIEPIGALRGDYQAAKICEVMANIHARKENDPPYHKDQFLMEFERLDPAEQAKKKMDTQIAYAKFTNEFHEELRKKAEREKAEAANG